MSRNKNNPNLGGAGIGHGSSAIAEIVPEKVIVSDPDLTPPHSKLPGATFEPGSPAGREAKPSPHADGFMPGVDG